LIIIKKKKKGVGRNGANELPTNNYSAEKEPPAKAGKPGTAEAIKKAHRPGVGNSERTAVHPRLDVF
jgi:hypothetical protein